MLNTFSLPKSRGWFQNKRNHHLKKSIGSYRKTGSVPPGKNHPSSLPGGHTMVHHSCDGTPYFLHRTIDKHEEPLTSRAGVLNRQGSSAHLPRVFQCPTCHQFWVLLDPGKYRRTVSPILLSTPKLPALFGRKSSSKISGPVISCQIFHMSIDIPLLPSSKCPTQRRTCGNFTGRSWPNPSSRIS